MTTKHEENVQMIKDCEDRESKLTNWELGFIAGISQRVADGRALTDQQAATLNEIWDRIT